MYRYKCEIIKFVFAQCCVLLELHTEAVTALSLEMSVFFVPGNFEYLLIKLNCR